MNLKNKIIVITGSTKGLGKALALAFSKEQAKMVINSVSKKELQKASKEIGVTGFSGDVTKEKDMQKLADFAVKKFGKVDIWINNAGIAMAYLPIEEINSKQAHEIMEVNFWGTFYGSKAIMKTMKKQKSGAIINIVSTSSLSGRPRSAIYSSSKWAVRGFTQALRLAIEQENVYVIAIYPGDMKTNLLKKFKPKEYNNAMEPSFVANKIIQNLKLKKPKEELIIKRK